MNVESFISKGQDMASQRQGYNFLFSWAGVSHVSEWLHITFRTDVDMGGHGVLKEKELVEGR